MMKLVINKGGTASHRPVITTVVLVLFFSFPLFADQALIEYFEGDVSVVRGAENFFADFGEPLDAGDLIVTGPGGLAVIRLNDRVQLKLRENTNLWIDSAVENAAVTLKSGGVFARVARSIETIGRRAAGFEVKTPTVVAGVRGTEFFVAYGRRVEKEPDLWLCVNEGTVEVSVPSTGQAVIVDEGEGINILAGLRATEPRFFPWTRELNWNFDPATGAIIDETNLDGAYTDLLDQDYD